MKSVTISRNLQIQDENQCLIENLGILNQS